jgi:hypothetical protein
MFRFPWHCLVSGTQTPPQVLPTQAFGQGVAVFHCPSWLQVRRLRLPWHWVASGLHTPPQALPTQAFGHGVGSLH